MTVRKRYTVGETDLWVPSLNLGVEVRDSWNPNEEIEIIRVLSDTNFRLRAANLCLVSPDDLSDEAFFGNHQIRLVAVHANGAVTTKRMHYSMTDGSVNLSKTKGEIENILR